MLRNEIAKDFMVAVITGYWSCPRTVAGIESAQDLAVRAFRYADAFIEQRDVENNKQLGNEKTQR